jgi:hypothetical protein
MASTVDGPRPGENNSWRVGGEGSGEKHVKARKGGKWRHTQREHRERERAEKREEKRDEMRERERESEGR